MFYGKRGCGCGCGRRTRWTKYTCKSYKTKKSCKSYKSYKSMDCGCKSMYEDKKGCGCYAMPMMDEAMEMPMEMPMHMHMVEKMKMVKPMKHMMMECDE